MPVKDEQLAGALRRIEGANGRLLFVCDHASNALPPGFALGVPPGAMEQHVAYDLGAAAVTEALAARFDAPAVLGGWSRLLVDCNRPPELAIPERSDGIVIPANVGMDQADLRFRLAVHAAFHDAITAQTEAHRPEIIVSVHSFTPALVSAPAPRPWPIALLWNEDDRATVPAAAALRQQDLGGPLGLNEPYSGKTLNYTMDRHAEDRGIASLGFEVRQDMLADAAGVSRWAAVMAAGIEAALAAGPWNKPAEKTARKAKSWVS